MLVSVFNFDIVLVHFVAWDLLYVWKHALKVVLAMVEPAWNFIENLKVFLGEVDIDAWLGLSGEALEDATLGLLGSPELFLLLSREVALVIFGVSLDQSLDGARNLLVANTAPNIIENILNVL